jgi:hypothetical protein
MNSRDWNSRRPGLDRDEGAMLGSALEFWMDQRCRDIFPFSARDAIWGIGHRHGRKYGSTIRCIFTIRFLSTFPYLHLYNAPDSDRSQQRSSDL